MKPILILALFSFFVGMLPASAEARIDILPRKILLEDRVRSGEITVLNLGEGTQVIRVTIIAYRQTATGLYEKIEEGLLNPAFDPEKMVRLSPRQFTLPPQGRQKIRFTVQRPSDMPPGDYRFHVRAISYDNEQDASGERVPTKGAGVSVKTNLGVAIPVVVRKGAVVSTGKIENVSLLTERQTEAGKPALKFNLKRTGTGSLMSVAKVFWENGQEKKQIGIISNLNVFAEIESRSVLIPLNELPQGGQIRIVLSNEMGQKEVIDEVVLAR